MCPKDNVTEQDMIIIGTEFGLMIRAFRDKWVGESSQ
jgi:hypothetical protein